jgi:hypothetical protein
MRKNKFLVLLALATFVFSINAFALLSAVVSVSPSSARINQLVTASVAISNTGSSALTLSNLDITATYNGNPTSRVAAAFGKFSVGPNAANLSLPAASTVTVPVQAVFFAPSTGLTGTGSGQYYIGANFATSDGSVTRAATAGRVTIDPLSNLDSTD